MGGPTLILLAPVHYTDPTERACGIRHEVKSLNCYYFGGFSYFQLISHIS